MIELDDQQTSMAVESISLKDFLENVPPNKQTLVSDLIIRKRQSGGYVSRILNPIDIELHCENALCKGIRVFKNCRELSIDDDDTTSGFLTYVCRNCTNTIKRYSVLISTNKTDLSGMIYKYGEHPAFGPSTPPKLLRVFGKEKEYFLKGRRCEIQGLGIGAFTYYRRIIEAKRNEIFDEVIRVARILKASEEMIADIGAAKKETQFSKGVDAIKHGIPQALLTDGHNPLKLLHNALSEGVHASSDEECLGIATSIRIVLTEFVEKTSNALKEEKTLNDAVSNLLKLNAKKGQSA